MFNTLFMKEIREAIYTHRFIMAVILCLVLIPTSVFITLKDYEQRHANSKNADLLYHQNFEGKVNAGISAEGYRPPSELSILSIGLEYLFPNKITTSRDGNPSLVKGGGFDVELSQLFGKIDFFFIVSYVLSLLAFIFTFSSITGEKENATLRLVISNPVPRWKVHLAKIAGNYSIFLVPFVISVLVMILIVIFTGSVNIMTAELVLKMAIILAATLLFILSMFTLGILVSTFTQNSATSIIVLLFSWVVLALIIPKLSPMLAETLYPVKSRQILDMEKRLVRKDLDSDFRQKQTDLLTSIALEYGVPENVDLFGFSGEKHARSGEIIEEYNRQKTELVQEHNERLQTEMKRLDDSYTRKKNTQTMLSKIISRVSPISCYAYIIAETSSTGLLELANINKNAMIFQDRVKTDVYDKFTTNTYYTPGGSVWSNTSTIGDFEASELPVPHMDNYVRLSISDIFSVTWVDIGLICFYNVLFFVAGFVGFLRYDVR